MVLAFDFLKRIAERIEKILVGGDNCPVQVESITACDRPIAAS
jgi:hypothetical protein